MNLYDGKTVSSYEMAQALGRHNDIFMEGIRRVLGELCPTKISIKDKNYRSISGYKLSRNQSDLVMEGYNTQQKLKVIYLWWDK